MPIEFVRTPDAPGAIGPYSQGTMADGHVYTAGQIALDPASGQVVEGGVQAETEQVLRNLAAILRAAGSDLSQVVKTTVYLVDMSDFPTMNEVYAKAFGQHRPARSTVAVSALPKGVRVEIDAIARTTASQ
ncbi:MAG: RidA family protein [Gemmatimonadales bacterium]|nr:MAG: RidA family protein [Gemmatimonadales bacterium]